MEKGSFLVNVAVVSEGETDVERPTSQTWKETFLRSFHPVYIHTETLLPAVMV